MLPLRVGPTTVCGDTFCFDGGVTADAHLHGSVRSGLRADWRSSSWPQRSLLLATAVWLAYEWSFGNETVTPWLLVRVIAETDGAESVVATAAVGFAFTALQQLASGLTAAAGFAMFSRTAQAAWRMLRSRLADEPRPWERQSILTRALVVFTLGTTAVVLIETTITGAVGARRHRRTIVEAATLCGAMVGALGAVVAAATWLGRSVPALEPATTRMLSVLGHPLFWISLLALVLVVNGVRGRRSAGRVS